MNILAIDTTGALASAAVMNNEGKIFSVSSADAMNHLQALFPMIQEVLDSAGINKSELGAVAAAVGPGSFTGIRIGVAAARTLAQALDIPMAAVTSLECFLQAEPGELYDGGAPAVICAALDARRRLAYSAAYLVKDGAAEEIAAPDCRDIDEFAAAAAEAAAAAGAECIVMYGDAADSYPDAVAAAAEKAGIRAVTAAPEDRYQNAVYIVKAAAKQAAEGKLVSYSEVKPVYLRKSEAERKLIAGQTGTKKKRELKKPQPAAVSAPADDKITYRRAGAEDIEAFAKLDALCFSHAWSTASFSGELDGSKNSYYAAAENQKGELVGFAGAAYIVDEGEINRVAVHPLYRSRGIADEMMNMVTADADSRGITDLMLEVREANRSAIALYKNHGFKVEGKREGYYAQTGENALLMRRKK